MSSKDIAISVQGLGKRYYTPQRAAGTRSRIAGHLKSLGLPGSISDEDYFWALKDVSFEVERGTIMGIMGKNGSGKSTLLKILSSVTPPTEGRAVIRGNLGSLLEVGTGFHPDLSGRDNVFMSGALLGLTRQEIASRFDEIVSFSGIEEFIDVPVKRYSSGMYVRLAYAVASMLQSDILILDEVLAVGDVQFREKSEKNMREVANSGRTILFVSHQPRTMIELCDTAMILDRGNLIYLDTARNTVRQYLQSLHNVNELAPELTPCVDLRQAARWGHSASRVLTHVRFADGDDQPCTTFVTGCPMRIYIGYESASHRFPVFEIFIVNEFGERVTTVNSTHSGDELKIPEYGEVCCEIPDLRLGEGTYFLGLDYATSVGNVATYVSRDAIVAAKFSVELGGFLKGTGLNSSQGAAHKSLWKPVLRSS